MKKFIHSVTPLLWITPVLAIFSGATLFRFIDGDEGFYLYAIELTRNGGAPYIDFFFPQMPYLLWIYSIFPFSSSLSPWITGRLISFCFTLGIAGTLYWYLKHRYSKNSWATIGVLLFSFSTLSFGWLPLIKTYGMTLFFLFASYTLTVNTNSDETRWRLLSGILFGIACGTRLYIAILFPLFLLFSRRKALPFLAGTVAALLPVLFFSYQSFDSFYFNNIRYHLNRAGGESSIWIGDKARLLLYLFGNSLQTWDFTGLQFSILFFPSIFLLIAHIKRKTLPSLSLGIVIVLFFFNFIPTPAFPQYFTLLIPFLIVNIFELFTLSPEVQKKPNGLILLFILFVFSGAFDLYRFTVSGSNVQGVDSADNWRIASVQEISDEIKTLSTEEDLILSSWPGYLVGSERNALPGTENHFGRSFTLGRDESERRRYAIANSEDIRNALIHGKPSLVVIGNNSDLPFHSALQLDRYQKIKELRNVKIFKRVDSDE